MVKAFLCNRVDENERPPLYYKFVMIRQGDIHDRPVADTGLADRRTLRGPVWAPGIAASRQLFQLLDLVDLGQAHSGGVAFTYHNAGIAAGG